MIKDLSQDCSKDPKSYKNSSKLRCWAFHVTFGNHLIEKFVNAFAAVTGNHSSLSKSFAIRMNTRTGGNFACACVYPLDYSSVIAGIYLEREV